MHLIKIGSPTFIGSLVNRQELKCTTRPWWKTFGWSIRKVNNNQYTFKRVGFFEHIFHRIILNKILKVK